MSNLDAVFSQAAKSRNVRVEDIHLDLPIPTWNGDLVGRFQVIDREVIDKFAAQESRSKEMDADFVIKAVRELYLHDPEGAVEGDVVRMKEDPDYVRIDSDGGTPAKFDQVLAEKLGLDLEVFKTARSVLEFCFKDNYVAIGGMASSLLRWMQNTDNKVVGQLVGESQASTS
jgi:hypothetical protein